jgi:cyclic pyranopterin phosphate synthase
LARVNISLDSLDDAVFQSMNGGRARVADVLKGIEAAERAGFSPIKINTVVQRGVNDHTLLDLACYCRERGHLLRFIEYMDAGTLNGWKHDHVLWTDELIQQIKRVIPLEPLPPRYSGEVVRRYRYAGGSGEIGFITSVTQPFCGFLPKGKSTPACLGDRGLICVTCCVPGLQITLSLNAFETPGSAGRIVIPRSAVPDSAPKK